MLLLPVPHAQVGERAVGARHALLEQLLEPGLALERGRVELSLLHRLQPLEHGAGAGVVDGLDALVDAAGRQPLAGRQRREGLRSDVAQALEGEHLLRAVVALAHRARAHVGRPWVDGEHDAAAGASRVRGGRRLVDPRGLEHLLAEHVEACEEERAVEHAVVGALPVRVPAGAMRSIERRRARGAVAVRVEPIAQAHGLTVGVRPLCPPPVGQLVQCLVGVGLRHRALHQRRCLVAERVQRRKLPAPSQLRHRRGQLRVQARQFRVVGFRHDHHRPMLHWTVLLL